MGSAQGSLEKQTILPKRNGPQQVREPAKSRNRAQLCFCVKPLSGPSAVDCLNLQRGLYIRQTATKIEGHYVDQGVSSIQVQSESCGVSLQDWAFA